MTCLMELLIAHPQFNFTENIIQFSVAYLNSPIVKLRQTVHTGIIRLFKNDKRGQVSYMAVRCINHHLKSKKREKVRPEMLDVLLSLKMYHLENPKDIATGHLQALAKAGKKVTTISRDLKKNAILENPTILFSGGNGGHSISFRDRILRFIFKKKLFEYLPIF